MRERQAPPETSGHRHGHRPGVRASHASRTAADGRASFLDRRTPGQSVLGPGSGTPDLARRGTPHGRVEGVDSRADTTDAARDAAARRGGAIPEVQAGDPFRADGPTRRAGRPAPRRRPRRGEARLEPAPATVRTLAVVAALTVTSACSSTTSPAGGPTQAATASSSVAVPSATQASVPPLSVSSTSVRDGRPFAAAQMSGTFGVPGGKDESPHLSWTPGPAGTKSYVVTVFDVDARSGSGFWHWIVYDIPATTHHLAAGAGAPGSAGLPAGAVQGLNDAGRPGYIGAAPPEGDPAHHYHLTVTAVDVARLPVDPNASPATIASTLSSHTLARGSIVATATTG